MHVFCGVRPLPSSGLDYTSRVPRSHHLALTDADAARGFPIYSMIGGKLTTFRAFAEQVADKLLARLGKSRVASTRERVYPGAEGYPQGEAEKRQWIARVAAASGLAAERVAALLERYGTEAERLAQRREPEWRTPLKALPDYTVGEIRMIAEGEQVVHLSDLVRRRSVITLLGRADETALAELAEIVGDVLGWDAESPPTGDRPGAGRGQGTEIKEPLDMAEMTSAERVMTVLRRGEPDRIPHFEWIIDKKVRHALCPGASTEEFTVRMGLDAMLTAPDFKTVQVAPNRFKNEWGIVVEKGEEQHSTVVQAAIQTMEDFEKYQAPDAFAPGRFDSLKKLVARYKGKYAIGVHLNDVLSIPRNLMGFRGTDDGVLHRAGTGPRDWWRCRWTSISSWPAKPRGTARISCSPATITLPARRPSCRPTRSGSCCTRG